MDHEGESSERLYWTTDKAPWIWKMLIRGDSVARGKNTRVFEIHKRIIGNSKFIGPRLSQMQSPLMDFSSLFVSQKPS